MITVEILQNGRRRANGLKSRMIEKLAAVFCALCLTAGVMSGVVFARGNEEAAAAEAEETLELTEPQATFVILDQVAPETASPVPEVVDNRTSVPLIVDGEERGICAVADGVPLVAPDTFCRALGLGVTISSWGDATFFSGDGYSLSAEPGALYFIFNNRYLFVPDGVAEQGGQLLLPVELLAECFGVTAAWDLTAWTVTVQADEIVPLEDGSTYYVETDVYWMSHVIYAEAGNQSLLGQIAVGSVVMNRIADEAFMGQDSVYDVIFAKNQFEVVINGMIYMEPSESAVIAAKLALDGADAADGATYFATFDFGDGYECVKWIEDHCFMVEAS